MAAFLEGDRINHGFTVVGDANRLFLTDIRECVYFTAVLCILE